MTAHIAYDTTSPLFCYLALNPTPLYRKHEERMCCSLSPPPLFQDVSGGPAPKELGGCRQWRYKGSGSAHLRMKAKRICTLGNTEGGGGGGMIKMSHACASRVGARFTTYAPLYLCREPAVEKYAPLYLCPKIGVELSI